jgi:multidrug efflux pump subunit AcrB
MTVRLEFPRGTPLETTQRAVERVTLALDKADSEFAAVEGRKLVSLVYSVAGAHSTYEAPRGSHLAEVKAEMIPSEDRSTEASLFLKRWEEEIGAIPGAVSLDVSSLTPGHFGQAIEIWILGEDIETMRDASADLRAKLGEITGVFNVEEDFRPGKREVRIEMKPHAPTLGLTFADIASQVRNAFYGSEALRVQRGRENIRVYVRNPLAGRSALSQVEALRISTPLGAKVPLGSVADFSIVDGYSRIVRERGFRRLVVTADVHEDQANASEILTTLEREHFSGLDEKYPNLEFSVEGQEKERQDSMASLGKGFALAALAIFLILATIFRSYVQPLVILTTVPFGSAGVIFSHLIMGYDLTMMSLFGLVALAGVVVNDAIILIEAVNVRLAEGHSFASAIRSGGVRRFRPVILTTLTTFFGLLPLIAEESSQAKFLIPMALAIAFGVAFATLLTLFLLPCQLGILNDVRRFVSLIFDGRVPSKEEVEPAVKRGAAEDAVHCVAPSSGSFEGGGGPGPNEVLYR